MCLNSNPWPGIEPTSLALEGRALTTGPAGKSFYFSISKTELPFTIISLSWLNPVFGTTILVTLAWT